MPLRILRAATALFAGLSAMTVAASVAFPQDEPPQATQPGADAADARKADEKKAEPKAVDVRFKVSIKGGGDVPANTKIEISGREDACGPLQTEDATSTVNDKGEAVFKNLPPCKVTYKVNRSPYLPVRQLFDLAGYKEPIQISLQREQ